MSNYLCTFCVESFLSLCALLSSMISMSRSELIMALAARHRRSFEALLPTVPELRSTEWWKQRINCLEFIIKLLFFSFLTHFCLSSAAFPTFKRKEIGKKFTLFILLISLSRERGARESEPIITAAKMGWSDCMKWKCTMSSSRQRSTIVLGEISIILRHLICLLILYCMHLCELKTGRAFFSLLLLLISRKLH